MRGRTIIAILIVAVLATTGCLGITGPSCELTADRTQGPAVLHVTFTLGVSAGSDAISSWSLDFNGDGNIEFSGTGDPPGTWAYDYFEPGEYEARFQVEDAGGRTCESTLTIIVS